MIQAYISAYRRAIDFGGRSSRKDYWLFFAGNVLVTVLIFCFAPVLAKFYYALSLIPSAAVAVRRVHDRNLPWYYILIPCYNMVLMFLRGDEGTNNYGPNPAAVTDGDRKIFSYEQIYCENCGAKIRPASKSSGKNIAIVIGWAIAIISVVVNIRLYDRAAMREAELDSYQYSNSELQEEVSNLENNNFELQEKVSDLENNNSELQEKVSNVEEEIDFYETHVALIPHDKYYHKYFCGEFQKYRSFFFAYDVERAKEIGFQRCPTCYAYEILTDYNED